MTANIWRTEASPSAQVRDTLIRQEKTKLFYMTKSVSLENSEPVPVYHGRGISTIISAVVRYRRGVPRTCVHLYHAAERIARSVNDVHCSKIPFDITRAWHVRFDILLYMTASLLSFPS
jgi:hypothetical protein